MPPVGGMWATAALRVVGKNLANASKMLRNKLATATRPLGAAELQPIAVRSNGSSRQPIHPAACLRQQKRAGSAKWFSTTNNVHTTVRRYLSNISGGQTGGGARFDRSKFPVSNTSRAVAQLTGRAPFASTLRPNLTGGALPRTAGGYSAGGAGRAGGKRYFSHTPAAPAQVVQNVSQAMRAFWLSGQRARYDGVGPNGEKRYAAVSVAHEEARSRLAYAPKSAPGSFIDFHISPTITALGPLGVNFPFATVKPQAAAGAATLNAEGFLDVLSVDFARALKDLAAVMTDLKRLSGLGDLPISLERNAMGTATLRVRFPGVDAETVERLCDDVGVQRGVVRQDADFDKSQGVPIALRFPFAPQEDEVATVTSPGGSVRSHNSGESSFVEDYFVEREIEENPWLSSPEPEAEGYESMSPPVHSSSGEHCSEDFEGLEGIYRFLEECDRAKERRF
ncbi:hypothetical protein QBC46DRAFT_396177 [Diplogelasinospora grovesii]|uniref:Casein kinase II beta 2 subunit n=1 Tax=Diplogelasinospora grovesii TaxID=303347 RepID=A0AAN6N212_9PEZI|nr:hypothetical protein QBC46DRAFT_396177 [Diplogelasinospora grovesii]